MSSPLVIAETESPFSQIKERKSPYYLHSHKNKYKSSYELTKTIEESNFKKVFF